MKRQRYFRGVKVLLECGHEAVLASSWYRLSPSLVASLLNHAIRGGVYCRHHEHAIKPRCQVVEARGTVRL